MARSFEYDERRERGKRPDPRRSRVSRPPTPVTPIPRRASASSPGSVRVRSRYSSISSTDVQEDVTRLPTAPPSAIWQDEADVYEIERHLVPDAIHEYSPFLPSSPSIDELDTLPPTMESLHDEQPRAETEAAQQKKVAIQFPIEIDDHSMSPMHRSSVVHNFPMEFPAPTDHQAPIEHIFPVEFPAPVQHIFPMDLHTPIAYREDREDVSEQVTNPPPVAVQPHAALELHNEPSSLDAVVEADTVMDDTLIIVPSLPSDIDMYPTQVEDAVDVALTLRARALLRHKKGSLDTKPAFIHDPLDYIRWWLLYPGRLEFLFWLGSAILLGIILCVVLVITGMGLGWMSFGHLAH